MPFTQYEFIYQLIIYKHEKKENKKNLKNIYKLIYNSNNINPNTQKDIYLDILYYVIYIIR